MNISREYINIELSNLVKTYLQDISLVNIRILCSELREKIEILVRAKIEEEGNLFVDKIVDIEKKILFVDFQKGYKSEMYKWLEENPISYYNDHISVPEYKNDIAKRKLLTTIGIGSIAAFSLFTVLKESSKAWIGAILVEVISAGIAYKSYLLGKEEDLRIYSEALEKLKHSLIDALKLKTEKYLNNIEQQSYILFSSYDLNLNNYV